MAEPRSGGLAGVPPEPSRAQLYRYVNSTMRERDPTRWCAETYAEDIRPALHPDRPIEDAIPRGLSDRERARLAKRRERARKHADRVRTHGFSTKELREAILGVLGLDVTQADRDIAACVLRTLDHLALCSPSSLCTQHSVTRAREEGAA